MKRLSCLTLLIFVGCISFIFFPPLLKLKIFTAIEKPWMRMHRSKPSSFLNEKLLEERIAKGLPQWAIQEIEKDLSKFKYITSKELDHYFKENDSAFNKLIRFKVSNGQLETFTHNPELLDTVSYEIMYNVIEYLVKKSYITNTDFILGLQDYLKLNGDKPVPIFTFAKDLSIPVEKDLILIPDWMNLRSVAELRPRIKYANSLFPWNQKETKIFWRGAGGGISGLRDKFIGLAVQHPDLIDAKISSFNPKEYVSEERHVQYKYQISIDGARCTWERPVWQLQSNSLMLKEKSSQVQWFYDGIIPFKHYVPIMGIDDVIKQITWAECHPTERQLIINNAMSFADNNLRLEDMYHYIIVLLSEYNKKLVH